jgi:hypothetical protein
MWLCHGCISCHKTRGDDFRLKCSKKKEIARLDDQTELTFFIAGWEVLAQSVQKEEIAEVPCSDSL